MLLGTIGLVAQDKDQIKDQDRDRIMLVDGDVLQIRDQDQIRLRDKITLNDGTILSPNGAYVTKDQVRLRLKDGSCLDNDGIYYRNEHQYRYKVQQENKGLSKAQIQVRNQNRYLLTMINGEMYQIKNKSQEKIQNQLQLGDGTTVNPDGTYQERNKQRTRLKDGECINMDGKMYKNAYTQRKMHVQKKMNVNKNMPKKNVQKKTSKKAGSS